MPKYTERFKQSLVSKVLMPNGPSALSIATESGISNSTLCSWVKKYKEQGGKSLNDLQRRPKDFTRTERFQAILDCEKLNSSELGAYLRKSGLTSEHIKKWKAECITGIQVAGVGRPAKDPEVKRLEQELKITKRDLRKKDKALAEAAALLILKKKAQEIWGSYEDEE